MLKAFRRTKVHLEYVGKKFEREKNSTVNRKHSDSVISVCAKRMR
jgi:hypothetical protein